MRKPSQIVSICAALLVIFAAGIATGRVTAPTPPVMMLTVSGKSVAADHVADRLASRLQLTPAERERILPIIEETVRKMGELPPGSQARVQLFRDSVPKMRSAIRPELQSDFDAAAREAERNFERAARWRERQGNRR